MIDRERVRRSARVAHLLSRRAWHYLVLVVRGARADAERRAALEERFAIRTAEDVAAELGNMKGVIMKAGQLVGFIAEGLPEQAQAALATLQADVPPMAPSLAEQVVHEELGAQPEALFLYWDPVPVAAASIGQVHKAVLRDGRQVAVKVQYPGVADAIRGDLANAEVLYNLFSSLALKSLDVRGLVEELRVRTADELDYTVEADHQAGFADRYRNHPFVSVPDVVRAYSARRVLTSDWVDGMSFGPFVASASQAAKQRAGEVIFRFMQSSVQRYGVFNGDPHPGNYLFGRDGSVTFVDFGLVKRFAPGEWEELMPVNERMLAGDVEGTVAAMEQAGFIRADHGLDAQHVWDYVSAPYLPFLVEEFTYSRAFMAETLGAILDVNGPYADVVGAINVPPSFLFIDRVVWGTSAILGKLGARNRWRGILDEYRLDAPPVTRLGRQEAQWRRQPSGG